jgi:holo-[acyl-carrier protein] synthase
MIVGIGCDIVEHFMTIKLKWTSSERVQKRIFSTEELILSQDKKPERFFSGRFAAKEAALKCLGTGMQDGIALTDVQVLQTDLGQPVIQVRGKADEIAKKLGITKWHVSITHSNQASYAFVIAER